MMSEFSDLERYALQEFKADQGYLKIALQKFCELKADEYRRACTQAMAHVPRDPETAADYAAKAQAFETFMQELMEG